MHALVGLCLVYGGYGTNVSGFYFSCSVVEEWAGLLLAVKLHQHTEVGGGLL